VCRRRRRIVREKTKKIRGGERRSDGDVKGKYKTMADCWGNPHVFGKIDDAVV
jgi:hypothetical protein